MDYEKAVNAILPGKYRHFKGNDYEVLCVAKHTETSEALVVYRELDGDEVWARPADMWNEVIEVNGMQRRRFQRLIEASHNWDDA